MNILDEMGIENATQADCANVAYVCSQVSTRAAHLCAAGNFFIRSTHSNIQIIFSRYLRLVEPYGKARSHSRRWRISVSISPNFQDAFGRKNAAIIDFSMQRKHFSLKLFPLLKNSFQFTLKLSEDGSGRGAALVAAVASRLAAEGLAKQLDDVHMDDSNLRSENSWIFGVTEGPSALYHL